MILCILMCFIPERVIGKLDRALVISLAFAVVQYCTLLLQ